MAKVLKTIQIARCEDTTPPAAIPEVRAASIAGPRNIRAGIETSVCYVAPGHSMEESGDVCGGE